MGGINNIKQRIYNILYNPTGKDRIGHIVEVCLIILVLINIVLAVADTFDIPEALKRISHITETVSVVIYTIEYVLRLWVADLAHTNMTPIRARLRHAFSLMEILDLLAILPFYIPFIIPVNLRVLHALRVIRLLWVLKISKYTHALTTIGAVFRRKAHQLLAVFCVVSMLLIIASVLMYNVESVAQPEVFTNALSGLWCAASALSSGDGNIYPITMAGRALSAFISLLGVGFMAVVAGILSSGFIEHANVTSTENTNEYVSDTKIAFCPYCGEKLSDDAGKKYCPYCGEKQLYF